MDTALKIDKLSKVYDNEKVLDNINLTIDKGDFVGIIGPNGAGKSTLLSIIAGITKPDNGSVTIEGKLTSILDVGAGFHPELTGRENIFLVVGLHGFSKEKAKEKLALIIEFSESKNYIDKPVKTYSSGMYLRLAFALFIHLDFDILLLDEVLGVGDFEFQMKAKNTLLSLKGEGKTIVLVSHNLSEIVNYCDRVIYLNKTVQSDAKDTNDAIIAYLSDNPTKRKDHDKRDINLKYDQFSFTDIENNFVKINSLFFSTNDTIASEFTYSDEITISINYTCKLAENQLAFVVKLFDVFDNMILCDSECFRKDYAWNAKQTGEHTLAITLPKELLGKGKYYVNLLLINNTLYEAAWHGIASFDVKLNSWMNEKVWSGINTGTLPKLDWKDTHL